MDFELSEDLKMVRSTVRRFVEHELIPLEPELPYDALDIPDPPKSSLIGKVKDMGLWAMEVPVEYGGAGLSTLGATVVTEETSKFVLGGVVFGGNAPNILYEGTDYQIENYLLPVVRGEKRGVLGLTEPSGGSDPAGAIQTRAVREGDNWVINGRKRFITGADKADFIILYARTDPEKGRAGITAFLVDTATPGVQIERLIQVIRPQYTTELVLENVVVPDANRLGEVGGGFQLGQRQLNRGRFGIGATLLGRCERAMSMAREYSKMRETFGQPLATRQAIQWMLADSEVEMHACRLMLYHAAWKADYGQDIRHEASIVKLYATEMAWRVLDRAIQIHGGIGVTKDLPLERWLRETRVWRIGEGPSEVHRYAIARNVLNNRGLFN